MNDVAEPPHSELDAQVLGATPNTPMTHLLYRYFGEHKRNVGYFLFVTNLASTADDIRSKAAKTLLAVYPDGSEKAVETQKVLEKPTGMFDVIKG